MIRLRSCLRMSFAGVCLLPKCARPEWQVSSTSCMTMAGGQWHLAGKCVTGQAGPCVVLTLMTEHVGACAPDVGSLHMIRLPLWPPERICHGVSTPGLRGP